MAIGLYLVRRRLPSRATFRAWDVALVFNILTQVFLLVMPWWPPAGGKGDVSFWYGTYVVVGVAILALCALYYAVWVRLLPWWGGYKLCQEVVVYGNGDCAKRLVKVPVGEALVKWEAEHDGTGRLVDGEARSDGEKSGVVKMIG